LNFGQPEAFYITVKSRRNIDMRSVRRFVLSLFVICLAYTGAQAAEPVPFVRVPAEESGLTHVVKQRSETNPTGIKLPWMSPLVDIDGDGNLDICYYGHHGGGAAIWLGKGDGTFTLDSPDYKSRWAFGTRAPLWWHVNNDNFIDGVSSQAMPGGFFFLNDGTGHWKKTTLSLLPARTWYPKLVDLDGDGHHCEMAVRDGTYELSPSPREWEGKFPEKVETKELWKVGDIIPWPEEIEHSRGTGFSIPYTVDLDGDHKNEVIVHFKEGFIGAKSFRSYVLTRDDKAEGTNAWKNTTADRGLSDNNGAFFPEDWDGDGDLDLIDLFNGFWYVNDGRGKFVKAADRLYETGKRQNHTYARTAYFVGDSTVNMRDLDNDGHLDLCMSGHHGQAHGYILNLGGGKSQEIHNIPALCMSRQLGDVDNDGDIDYVTKGKRGEATMVFVRNEITNRGLFIRIIPKNAPEQQLGCKVWVYEAGQMGKAAGLISFRQCFMLNPASKAEVIDGRLHIGMGTRTEVDIRVRFPSGEIREAKAAKAGKTTDLKE
jgi:hypothetical protein